MSDQGIDHHNNCISLNLNVHCSTDADGKIVWSYTPFLSSNEVSFHPFENFLEENTDIVTS